MTTLFNNVTMMQDTLTDEARGLGKPAWRPLLEYVARLHARAVHPALPPLPHAWEEIGPGYCGRPAFGHWDIVHAVLDTLPAAPAHGARQMENLLSLQSADGFVPAIVYFHDPRHPFVQNVSTCPPVWPVAVQKLAEHTGDDAHIASAYEPLLRQIGWFERERAAMGGGFFYLDAISDDWESGVDEGVRFDARPPGPPAACVDATSHVLQLYDFAALWSRVPGRNAEAFAEQAAALRAFIQTRLWDDETGWFHDQAAVGHAAPMALEGMWPLVTGAATPAQARGMVEGSLLNPERFGTPHPLATVGRADPKWEKRMWRGPAWNSQTFWAATGCIRYGHADAARQILEQALEMSATHFAATGTVWEFYDADGGDPRTVERKPQTTANAPSRDYLGHNPLLAMARLWERAGQAGKPSAAVKPSPSTLTGGVLPRGRMLLR